MKKKVKRIFTLTGPYQDYLHLKRPGLIKILKYGRERFSILMKRLTPFWKFW